MNSLYKVIPFIAIFLFCRASSCKNCVEATYQFKMEESFSPEKDSIKIGDTIWLSATHTSIFIDATNNQEINFSNSSLGANVRILQLPDNSSDVSGAINDFSIIKTFGIEGGNDNIPSERLLF